ncbi:MAG: hypothetical protein MUF87_16875 [Anaerolineae bacterium]|nr:hypothetical protein [Anaerolineae bacterium]
MIIKPHYLFVTRLLIDLYQAGELPNVRELQIEPEYGYVGRIVYHSGAVRLYRGTNLDVNSNGASEMARDKGYTKYFLDRLGYQVPIGRVFLMPFFQRLVQRNLSRHGLDTYAIIDQIEAYIDSIGGYPCFVKPNEESQGKGVYRCADSDDLHTALAEYDRERYRTILVERLIPFPDYRVLIFDGTVIAVYARQPFTLIGDGHNTIRALITHAQAELHAQKRPPILDLDDPRMIKKLMRAGLTLDHVLSSGTTLAIHDISNLSAGGSALDLTADIDPHWAALSIRAVADMGLRLCGVDLACADIRDPHAEYAIIELNHAPIVENYASLGEHQAGVIRDLYRRIFNEIPAGGKRDDSS